MGMYDDVDYKFKCPVCGEVVNGFQSKDGDCVMATIEPRNVDNFYMSCYSNDCDGNTWLEFTRTNKRKRHFYKLTVDIDHVPQPQYTQRVIIL